MNLPKPLRRLALPALLIVPLGLGMGLALSSGPGAQTADAVTLQAARDAHEAGRAVLIDIREPNEHARGVAAGARLLPMSQLPQRLAEIPTDPAMPVLLICNTQNRSSATLKALRQQGYAHVRYVDGGMAAWVRRGWPVVPPGP
ncbi:MAG: rhodanese-like domain-containing protein [Burkholderiales bacterium]|nr:rhodanese-like domain-containing protein [Burkholderiales bacterium]